MDTIRRFSIQKGKPLELGGNKRIIDVVPPGGDEKQYTKCFAS